MEEKKNSKKSILAFLLIIAIIIIIAMGYYIYKLWDENKIQSEENIGLNKQIDELKEKTTNLDKELTSLKLKDTSDKTDTTSKIELSYGSDEVLYVTNASENSDGSYTLKGVVYTKLTMTKDELEEIAKKGIFTYKNEDYTEKKDYTDDSIKYDYAFFEEFNGEDMLRYIAKRKDDNSYYIENITENSSEWKMTDIHIEINVAGDITVLKDPENSTVKETFKDFNNIENKETSNPTPSYRFKFENGKCVEMKECILGY